MMPVARSSRDEDERKRERERERERESEREKIMKESAIQQWFFTIIVFGACFCILNSDEPTRSFAAQKSSSTVFSRNFGRPSQSQR